MRLIICLDDKNGMLFNKRRQSSDRVLCEHIVAMTKDTVVWMNGYSAKLFEKESGNIRVDEDFMKKAGRGEYAFAETTDVMPYLQEAEELIVFRWNRVYTSDVRLPASVLEENWRKVQTFSFSGYSHDMITQEVYTP